MMDDKRFQLADDFLRRFASALRSAQLYSAGHPIIARNIDALMAGVEHIHASQPTITIGIVGAEIVVGDVPVGKVDLLGDLTRRMLLAGIERVAIEAGVAREEIADLVQTLASVETRRTGDSLVRELPAFPHIRLGRIQIEPHVEDSLADAAAIRRLYDDAVSVAGVVWESAKTEKQPDAPMARSMVDGLAQAVAQNRPALMALTALKTYDNYTFTHMVNVSILTMGQARGLGIDGPLLREFGMAALMHDLGKVQTPIEVLNKPDKLTDAEFAIMKRHTVDGAEMLRRTPDIPTLAPVVAFEHHLRRDGSGYPHGVTRPTLNICTMLCSIADVYDAMRSKRRYQQAFPTDRILEVLKLNDGQHFDQHLVRRFVQLIGIYPPGNLVRLNTGEIAVVVKVYAPDPYRPQVRVLFDRAGFRLDLPYDVNLWDAENAQDRPSSVVAPLDPADYAIDPLVLM
jgi:putative nucleotidyltransferase with HDIG domain